MFKINTLHMHSYASWNPLYVADENLALTVFTTQLGSGSLIPRPKRPCTHQVNCWYATCLYCLFNKFNIRRSKTEIILICFYRFLFVSEVHLLLI